MTLAAIALGCAALLCILDLRHVFRFIGDWRSLTLVRRREHRGALAAKVGARIALSGTYRGSPLESHWTIAQVSTGASPDASSTEALDAVLETPHECVLLEGALQVVLAPQRYSAKEQVLRTVMPGASILAEGTLEEIPAGARTARATEQNGGHYRSREVGYRLVPYIDNAWPKRPLAIFQIPKYPIRPTVLTLALLACCTIFATPRSFFSNTAKTAPAIKQSAALHTSECITTIEHLLRSGNPWEAKEQLKACPNSELAAHTEWLLGHVAEAASLFQIARLAAPEMTPTAAEAEALLSAGVPTAQDVTVRLREEWYRGPETAQKRVLGCIGDRLFPKLWGLHEKAVSGVADADAADLRYPSPSLAYECTHRSNGSNGDVLGGVHIHSLPAYALHDPTAYHATYQRTFPNPALEETYHPRNSDTCESDFPSLTAAATFSCEGSMLAQRLLFAALTKDESLYAQTLAALTPFIALHKALPNVRMGPETPKQLWALEMERKQSQDPNRNRADMFDSERGSWIFSIEKVASVVAAAAHHMGDVATRDLFLEYADDHPAGMLREHLRLANGEDLVPKSSHSPSDYSGFEMELFSKVTELSPQAFQSWLAEHHYGNPTRIEALLSQRPEHMAAVERWNRAGFLPLRHGPSYLELVHHTFQRRRIAELAGDVTFANQLKEVGNGLAAAVKKNSASYSIIFAFETVVLMR
jgi:hypothetical protein